VVGVLNTPGDRRTPPFVTGLWRPAGGIVPRPGHGQPPHWSNLGMAPGDRVSPLR